MMWKTNHLPKQIGCHCLVSCLSCLVEWRYEDDGEERCTARAVYKMCQFVTNKQTSKREKTNNSNDDDNNNIGLQHLPINT